MPGLDIHDEDDETQRLLRRILAAVTRQQSGATVDVTREVDASRDVDVENTQTTNVYEPDEQDDQPGNVARYYSTGAERVQLPGPGDDPQRLEFGFIAGNIHIRHDGPVEAYLARPVDANPIILEGEGQSIFGEGGLPASTAFIWLATPAGASSATTVRVEALPASP
jgi:hypothetical protein